MYLICRYSGQYEDFQETILGYVTSKEEADKRVTLFNNDLERIRQEIEDLKKEYDYHNLNHRDDNGWALIDECEGRVDLIKSLDEGLHIDVHETDASYGVVEIKELV